MGRNVYLKMKTLAEARELLINRFSHLQILTSEMLAVPDAVGRVLAEPVIARLSSPNFHAAAMDGVAVKASGLAKCGPKTWGSTGRPFF
jgi:putative molybdopterin biosynthesis protein